MDHKAIGFTTITLWAATAAHATAATLQEDIDYLQPVQLPLAVAAATTSIMWLTAKLAAERADTVDGYLADVKMEITRMNDHFSERAQQVIERHMQTRNQLSYLEGVVAERLSPPKNLS